MKLPEREARIGGTRRVDNSRATLFESSYPGGTDLSQRTGRLDGKEVISGQNTTLNGAIATLSAATEPAAVAIPVSFVVERERKR